MMGRSLAVLQLIALMCLGSSSDISMPDPFVQTAPLVVAMACRDGVAIVAAAHSNPSSEPLIYYDGDSVSPKEETAASKDKEAQERSACFRDVPLSYAGPVRIRSVGGPSAATALVTCGWRADGNDLISVARKIMDSERQEFGQDDSGSSSKILPSQLSLYMAECAVDDGMRALSCACLVAFPSTRSNTALEKSGSLWLVDETGAYPVRAHCLGGGLMKTKHKKEAAGFDLVSDVVNRKLLLMLRKEKSSLPYFDLSVEEGLEQLLCLISGRDDTMSPEAPTKGEPLLDIDTRLELAVVDAKRHQVVRKRVDAI